MSNLAPGVSSVNSHFYPPDAPDRFLVKRGSTNERWDDETTQEFDTLDEVREYLYTDLLEEVEGTDWGDSQDEANERVKMAEFIRWSDDEKLIARHTYGVPTYEPCYIKIEVI